METKNRPKKRCSKCGKIGLMAKRGSGTIYHYYSFCLKCASKRQSTLYNTNKISREWRKKYNLEVSQEKKLAYSMVHYGKETGKIKKPFRCSVCNKKSEYIQGHHHDYSKPLDVVWLCTLCHSNAHHAGKYAIIEGVKC